MRKLALFLTIFVLSAPLHASDDWSTTSKLAFSLTLTSFALDAYSTHRFLAKEGTYETNPLLGKHPGDGKIIAYFACYSALTWILGDFMPDKWRPYLFLGVAAAELKASAHNFSIIFNW